MRVSGRGKWTFFLILGICLTVLAVALYVGWILLSLEQIVFLVLGIVFFSLIITGLVLNTLFLIREIRRNEQHNAFLNAVTHELKTPIASIRLYLETLQKREVAPEKQQEFYSIMLADSDRLLNTVEQVLEASRTREGRRSGESSPVELNALLTGSIERIKNRYDLDASAIAFEKQDPEVYVSGDAGELETVFTNLLDNAVKYADQKVEIFVSISDLNETKAEVNIKDLGIGIPRSEFRRIFRRFYRVPSSEAHQPKGTGLGLSIVAAIVKKHRGKIRVESGGDEKGTEFIVQLPKPASESTAKKI